MIARKARLSRDLRKVQRQIVVVVDKTARTTKPLVNVRAGRFRLTKSSFGHFSTQRQARSSLQTCWGLVGACEILLRVCGKRKGNCAFGAPSLTVGFPSRVTGLGCT